MRKGMLEVFLFQLNLVQISFIKKRNNSSSAQLFIIVFHIEGRGGCRGRSRSRDEGGLHRHNQIVSLLHVTSVQLVNSLPISTFPSFYSNSSILFYPTPFPFLYSTPPFPN